MHCEDQKNDLIELFTGDDYKRQLKKKLRNLIFAKDMNIDLFANMIKTTVKDFYSLQGDTRNAVDAIG